jgi:hypothetical protein
VPYFLSFSTFHGGVIRYKCNLTRLNPRLVKITFKSSVPSSQQVHSIPTAKVKWYLLVRGLIGFHYTSRTGPVYACLKNVHFPLVTLSGLYRYLFLDIWLLIVLFLRK